MRILLLNHSKEGEIALKFYSNIENSLEFIQNLKTALRILDFERFQEKVEDQQE